MSNKMFEEPISESAVHLSTSSMMQHAPDASLTGY